MGRGNGPWCEEYQRAAMSYIATGVGMVSIPGVPWCAITGVETIPTPVAMLLNTPPAPSGLPQYRTLLGSQHHPREPDATDRFNVCMCICRAHTGRYR